MIKFFQYNWQVRDEWFEWCKQLSPEELIKKRDGGVGSFLQTLFHIIEVEYSWIRGMQVKEDIVFEFHDYNTLEKVKSLSDEIRGEIVDFFRTKKEELNNEKILVAWENEPYTRDAILHHVIAHEIHHIGQLSVWARQLHLAPVPAHFIGRNL
ncbi:DinB family protein [Alkalihalobacterium elongatum]|uniref:DinB family protein n=1 Tax=Alkalihalobacterium elongatum TaxID=2675466 RepID=UPI001C1F43A2|nr:DinB family protein [Alkalihalobacterium elongatum]